MEKFSWTRLNSNSVNLGSTVDLATNIYNYRMLAVKLAANRLYSIMFVPLSQSTNLAWGGLFSQADERIILQGGTMVIRNSGNTISHEHAWLMTIFQETGIQEPQSSNLNIEEL